jgi:hypothetical protein
VDSREELEEFRLFGPVIEEGPGGSSCSVRGRLRHIGKDKSRTYMKKKSKAIGVNVTSIIFEEICSFSLFYTFIFARVQCFLKIIDIKKCFLCFL